MKKLIFVLSLLVTLAACSDPNTNKPAIESKTTSALQKTKGLEDCILYDLDLYSDTSSSKITIVRCGSKPTTTVIDSSEKDQKTSVLIEGVGEIPVELK